MIRIWDVPSQAFFAISYRWTKSDVINWPELERQALAHALTHFHDWTAEKSVLTVNCHHYKCCRLCQSCFELMKSDVPRNQRIGCACARPRLTRVSSMGSRARAEDDDV
jgi:hypothetical protein